MYSSFSYIYYKIKMIIDYDDYEKWLYLYDYWYPRQQMILFNEFKCIHKNQCQEFYYFTYYQRPTWTNLGGTKEEKLNSESSKVTMKRTFRTDGGVLSNTFICSAKDRPEYMGRTFRCFFMPYRDRVRACSCRRDTTFSTSSWRSRLNKKRQWQEVRPKRKVDKKKTSAVSEYLKSTSSSMTTVEFKYFTLKCLH